MPEVGQKDLDRKNKRALLTLAIFFGLLLTPIAILPVVYFFTGTGQSSKQSSPVLSPGDTLETEINGQPVAIKLLLTRRIGRGSFETDFVIENRSNAVINTSPTSIFFITTGSKATRDEGYPKIEDTKTIFVKANSEQQYTLKGTLGLSHINEFAIAINSKVELEEVEKDGKWSKKLINYEPIGNKPGIFYIDKSGMTYAN